MGLGSSSEPSDKVMRLQRLYLASWQSEGQTIHLRLNRQVSHEKNPPTFQEILDG